MEKLRIPPAGTKGGRATPPGPLKFVARIFLSRNVASMRRVRGSEPGKFMGVPALVLTTVGARTGNEHSHVLGAIADGPGAWLVVASNAGARTHPAWFFNAAKNPDQVWFQVGDRKWKAHVESLQGAVRDAAYARIVKVAPVYGGYEKKTDREIPVLRLTQAE